MASGLVALLDDVATIAKTAAASLDDAAAQAARAGAKAAGVVIDDTTVTPRYVTGFSAERELAVVGRIALGSLRNKLVLLLPGVLVLSEVWPGLITPLLMLGGVYLCFEGAEKVVDLVRPEDPEPEDSATLAASARQVEDAMVAGAIRTDLILSAEIMVIALSAIQAPDLLTRALALATAGVAITVGVYGAVALIVKADDIGAGLARGRMGWRRTLGCALVRGMPRVLAVLSTAGVLAMLWVGAGFLIHGLAEFGIEGPEAAIEMVQSVVEARSAILHWLAGALASALVGLGTGQLLLAASRAVKPAVAARHGR